MTPFDILWVGSIAVAFIVLSLVTAIFFKQDGRTRLYLAAMLLSVVILALVSLITALGAGDSNLTAWFKVPRALAWLLVAFTSLLMLLYQLNLINGMKVNGMKAPPDGTGSRERD